MSLTDPEIRIVPEQRYIGMMMHTTLTEDVTGILWAAFMPEASRITERHGMELYSIIEFGDMATFTPSTIFKKWAAVAVADTSPIPEGMKSICVPEGKYACFTYHGHPAKGSAFFNAIFTEWLPQSGFRYDNRPQFAVMGKAYHNQSDDSEEVIMIPIASR